MVVTGINWANIKALQNVANCVLNTRDSGNTMQHTQNGFIEFIWLGFSVFTTKLDRWGRAVGLSQ